MLQVGRLCTCTCIQICWRTYWCIFVYKVHICVYKFVPMVSQHVYLGGKIRKFIFLQLLLLIITLLLASDSSTKLGWYTRCEISFFNIWTKYRKNIAQIWIDMWVQILGSWAIEVLSLVGKICSFTQQKQTRNLQIGINSSKMRSLVVLIFMVTCWGRLISTQYSRKNWRTQSKMRERTNRYVC